jgi:Holliday junction resolvase-like predicted endonuclease
MSVENLLGRPLRVINLGLEVFAQALEADGVTVLHVDWQPPAGEADLLALLDDE